MDLGALGGGPDAVLPISGFGRDNWGPWQGRGECRRPGFASDKSDNPYAALRQDLADKTPDSGPRSR
jgi:hypothetical protein